MRIKGWEVGRGVERMLILGSKKGRERMEGGSRRLEWDRWMEGTRDRCLLSSLRSREKKRRRMTMRTLRKWGMGILTP